MQLALTRSPFIATESGEAPPRWDYRVGIGIVYIQSPLVLDRGGERIEVISSRTTTQVQGAVQFGKWVGLGVALPLVVADDGSPDVAHGAGIGDLRLVPRIEILNRGRVHLAALLGLRLPSGQRGRLLGDGMVVFEPRLALQIDWGKFQFGSNFGVRIREERTWLDLQVGNEMYLTLAAAYTPKPWISAVVELHGDTPLNSRFTQSQGSPLELLFGVFAWWHELRAGLSAGFGTVEGFGSPRARVMASIEYRRYDPPPPPPPPPVLRPIPPAKPKPKPSDEMTFDPDVPEVPEPEPEPEISPEEPDVAVHRDRIELADPIFFDKDRKRVHHRYYPELEQLVRALKKRTKLTLIWIEGHADATGPARWNLELSRLRADAVAQFLIQHGIEAKRLRPVGFGEARPLVKTPRGEANEKNRRVHFFTDSAPPTEPAEDTEKTEPKADEQIDWAAPQESTK